MEHTPINKNKYLANKLKWGNKFKANTGRVIKSIEYMLVSELKRLIKEKYEIPKNSK